MIFYRTLSRRKTAPNIAEHVVGMRVSRLEAMDPLDCEWLNAFYDKTGDLVVLYTDEVRIETKQEGVEELLKGEW